MSNKFLFCVITLSSFVVASSAFEPAFKLVQPEGKVKIQTPASKRSETPRVDQAYAYGSTITIEKGSSVNVILGNGSSVKLTGAAVVGMKEDGDEKIIDLKSGKAEFNLAKDSGKLKVQSKGIEISPVSAGTFTVDARRSYSFNSVGIVSDTAQVAVKGDQFDIKKFGPKSELSISSASDGSYSKIQVPKGNLNLTFDTDDGDKNVKVEKGETVAIYRKVSNLGITVVSTVIITGADSTVKQQFSFSKKLKKRIPINPASTTTTTTTTTTSSTTVKSPTPVGER
ncbi:MAG: FecR domain-containing protein [Kiritimatiellae bacterium]|jgi:hypothetical protein|nr:FecR domain-containing protein [Kiritimatiellia bacterium]